MSCIDLALHPRSYITAFYCAVVFKVWQTEECVGRAQGMQRLFQLFSWSRLVLLLLLENGMADRCVLLQPPGFGEMQKEPVHSSIMSSSATSSCKSVLCCSFCGI